MNILILLYMIYFLFLISLCLLALMLYIYANLFYTIFLKVPMLSTGSRAIESIIKNIDCETSKNFYDLGSGNGSVVTGVAHHCPIIRCIGVEYNIGAYCLAKIKNIFLTHKVEYLRSDFFKINLADADIVYVYLFPKIIKCLEEKFSKELKKGTIVIANTFPLETRKPKKIIPNEKEGSLDILYVYEF